MAVIDVKRDASRTQGPVSTPEGVTGAKVFSVKLDGSDDADAAPVLAAGASGVPSLFSYWSASVPTLRCVSISPAPVGTASTLYDVVCQYSTGPESEDPLDEPPTVSTGSMSIRELRERDRNGTLIVNSAGDPIEVEEDVKFRVLRLGRNVASHSFVQEARYHDSVNLSPILGAPAECLWMVDFRASKVIYAEGDYWRQEMEIAFNHLRQPSGETAVNAPSNGYQTWARRLANLGLRVRGTNFPPPTPIIDQDSQKGDPISTPVPLNLGGTAALESGCIWLYYYTKAAEDWRPLRLSLT